MCAPASHDKRVPWPGLCPLARPIFVGREWLLRLPLSCGEHKPHAMSGLDREYLERVGAAKRVQVRMMADRGHAISDAERGLAALTPLQVAAEYVARALERRVSLATALGAVYEADTTRPPPQGSAPPRTAVVWFDRPFDDARRVDRSVAQFAVQEELAALAAAGLVHAVFVFPAKLSPPARRILALPPPGLHVQQLPLAALAFPVVDHILVPPHRALAPPAAAALLARLALKPEQLPILSVADPVAAYYGYAPGTIVRVERDAGGADVAYRIVRILSPKT